MFTRGKALDNQFVPVCQALQGKRVKLSITCFGPLCHAVANKCSVKRMALARLSIVHYWAAPTRILQGNLGLVLVCGFCGDPCAFQSKDEIFAHC